MINIGRWNYETREYDPYQPNPEWTIKIYSEDMSEHINCTNCGKDMTFGDGYTSRELHNSYGIGYPVCESCYEDERNKELSHDNA